MFHQTYKQGPSTRWRKLTALHRAPTSIPSNAFCRQLCLLLPTSCLEFKAFKPHRLDEQAMQKWEKTLCKHYKYFILKGKNGQTGFSLSLSNI